MSKENPNCKEVMQHICESLGEEPELRKMYCNKTSS